MARRPAHHRVKIHSVYSVAEAAEVTGVCRQTVQRWITHHGLPAACEQRPWLIRGADLKCWLMQRAKERRTPLKPGEIYCLPCRRAWRPAGDAVDLRPNRSGTLLLIGICPGCDRLMHRVVSAADMDRITAGLDVALA